MILNNNTMVEHNVIVYQGLPESSRDWLLDPDLTNIPSTSDLDIPIIQHYRNKVLKYHIKIIYMYIENKIIIIAYYYLTKTEVIMKSYL